LLPSNARLRPSAAARTGFRFWPAAVTWRRPRASEARMSRGSFVAAELRRTALMKQPTICWRSRSALVCWLSALPAQAGGARPLEADWWGPDARADEARAQAD